MLLIDLYKEIKNYLTLQIIDEAIKVQMQPKKNSSLEKANYQLVKTKKERKNSLEKANYNLVRRKEGRK